MKLRELGRTGLKVSEIGLGTEYLYGQSRETVISVIKKAIKNGINYFDLVFNVSNYIKNISAAIKDNRDDIIITCHLGSVEFEGKVRRTHNVKDCEKTILNSLSLLRKDYIDIINLQFVKEKQYESLIATGGLLDLAKKLQIEGKAKFIGISTHNNSLGLKAAKCGYFDVIMHQINIANDTISGRNDFLKACVKNNVGLVAIKPFAGGKLLQTNRTVHIAKYQTGGISLKKKIPKSSTPIKCLNYTLSQSGVSTTIPGVKSSQELNEVLAFLNASDEEKEFSTLLKEFEDQV
ncbi:MAG: aldo/keto reductase [Promethearchaeota archaeon]